MSACPDRAHWLLQKIGVGAAMMKRTPSTKLFRFLGSGRATHVVVRGNEPNNVHFLKSLWFYRRESSLTQLVDYCVTDTHVGEILDTVRRQESQVRIILSCTQNGSSMAEPLRAPNVPLYHAVYVRHSQVADSAIDQIPKIVWEHVQWIQKLDSSSNK